MWLNHGYIIVFPKNGQITGHMLNFLRSIITQPQKQNIFRYGNIKINKGCLKTVAVKGNLSI